MSLDLGSSQAYFRDGFIPFSEANLSIASPPVLYGLGVYTVFCVSRNEQDQKLNIFRLKDHYRRLVNSSQIMGMQSFTEAWPYSKFEQTMLELLRRNNIEQDSLVRVTVFVDELMSGTRVSGLKVSLSAFVYPMGEFLPLSGIRACVSSWTRTADNAIPSRAKVTGSYANSTLMKNEALLNGYDEAISIDQHGHVAEGTVANLFLVKDGTLITPDSATDMLEGITRDTIMTLSKELELSLQQRSVDRSELYIADEAFMCGSSARITPILSIDKRPMGDGQIGPITKQLMEKYEAIQRGSDSSHPEWLQTL